MHLVGVVPEHHLPPLLREGYTRLQQDGEVGLGSIVGKVSGESAMEWGKVGNRSTYRITVMRNNGGLAQRRVTDDVGE